jgi:hypothetical protein
MDDPQEGTNMDQQEQGAGDEIAAYTASLEEMISSTDGTDWGGHAGLDLYGTIDGHSVRIMFNSHARTPEGALRNLLKGVSVAVNEFHMKPYNPKETAGPAQNAKPAGGAPAPAGTVNPPARTAGNPPAPAGNGAGAPPPPGGNAPAAPATTGGAIAIQQVKVLPQPDGKSKVEFWNPGRKYAELNIVMMPDKVAKMFSDGTGAAWTLDHFNKAGLYNVNLSVTWVPSKNVDSKGVPYKNVAKIENA